MLNKIIEIKTLGKFKSFTPIGGDLQFDRFTLIYADNGTGKTTLSSAIRSLSLKNPKILIGRKTLGSTEVQSAKLLVNNVPVEFKDDNWSECSQKFEIFDSQFIVDNIFSGNIIGHDHRRNLHKVIIGEEGVALAHRIEALDDEIRQINSESTQISREISKKILGALPLEDFIGLSNDLDAEDKARKVNEEIQSIEKAAQIKATKVPESILFNLDVTSIGKILSTNFESIGESAGLILNQHFNEHGLDDMAWFHKGLASKKTDACPFCGQNVEGVELIKLYRGIFDKAFIQYRTELENYSKKYTESEQRRLSEKIESDFKNNESMIQRWKEYVDVSKVMEFQSVGLATLVSDILKEVRRLIELKLSGRDIRVEPQEIEQAIGHRFKTFKDILDKYNFEIENLNSVIVTFKENLSTANLADLKRRHLELLNVGSRYKAEVSALCEQLKTLSARKDALDTEKSISRKSLEAFTEGVFSKYQTTINHLLSDFGATFTVEDKKENFVGGKPSTSFKLCINGIKFDPEPSETDESKPSFRNTLSEGEKSTLAFCYFLARLKDDKDIANKIVVFDDPLSSFDVFRREKTKQAVILLGNTSKQVIVLSHDKYFLRLIWDSAIEAKPKCFNLFRKGEGIAIAQYDIEKETRNQYLQDYHVLVDYFENGVPNGSEAAMRAVARSIRPVIEYNLHMRFPNGFKEKEWLGDCIGKIRIAKSEDPIVSLQSQIDLIGSINDYSKRFAHKENANSETEPINDTELRHFVKQCFQVVSGIVVAHTG